VNKHTPGPWGIQWRTIWCDKADNFISGDEYAEHIRAPGEGELYERESICGTCDGCNLIKAANARLIAAAPELLEALQKLIKLSDMLIGKSDVIDEAKSVVFKATGEYPE
jgi:hypothetical protein